MFREFPLDNLAAAASMLARCAGGDKTYPLIEVLFEKQGDWAFVEGNPVPKMFEIAKQAGFTQESLRQLPEEPEAARRSHGGTHARLRRVRCHLDAHVLHQRQAPRGAARDGHVREGDRPAARKELGPVRGPMRGKGGALIALLLLPALIGCAGEGVLATAGLTADDVPKPDGAAAAYPAAAEGEAKVAQDGFNPFADKSPGPPGGREVIAKPTRERDPADRHSAGHGATGAPTRR